MFYYKDAAITYILIFCNEYNTSINHIRLVSNVLHNNMKMTLKNDRIVLDHLTLF